MDDSDGIYLKGVFGSHKRSKNEARQGSLIQDCTFAHGADDAIDINGDNNDDVYSILRCLRIFRSCKEISVNQISSQFIKTFFHV